MASKREQLQQAISKLSPDDVRQMLTKIAPDLPALSDAQVAQIQRRAATVNETEQRQIETQDYVFGEPMGQIDELAFDLLAIEERKYQPTPEPPLVAPYALEPGRLIDPPF
jgi:hypothetical protein